MDHVVAGSQVHGGADRVLQKLYELVRQHGSVTIKIDETLTDDWGQVDFTTGTIRLAPDLTRGEFRTTLTHEMVHLTRGPVPAPRQAMEELLVERETAAILIPEHARQGFARRRRTPTELQRMAEAFDVDEQLVADQFEPPDPCTTLEPDQRFWFRPT